MEFAKWPLVAGLCPSLTQDSLLQLKDKGIETVLDFVSMNPERITAVCGLPFKRVLAIRRVLLAQYSSFPVNGLDLYEETLNTIAVLPTGCKKLDNFLECGIYTGEVTEIVGVSASAKTQFCHHFAVNVAATLKQNVIYIDSTGGCSVRRMAELLKLNHPDEHLTSTLSLIQVCKCQSFAEFQSALREIRNNLQNQETFCSALKVIIVDSVSAILEACVYATSFVEGMSDIQKMGREINKLAKDFAIAILVINDVVSTSLTTPSTSNHTSFSKKPALGRCWSHVPSVRLTFEPVIEPPRLSPNDLLKKEFPSMDFTVNVAKSPRNFIRSINLSVTRHGIGERRK